MPLLRTRLALAVGIFLFFTGCGSEKPPAEKKPEPLEIYYLWTTAGDPHQHSSIETGVEKAKADPDIMKMFGERVEVDPLVDPASKEEAIALAQKLRVSAGTLAVIGHTYSTWSTLPIFADAGIPVLITNATSPYLLLQHTAPGTRVRPWGGWRA